MDEKKSWKRLIFAYAGAGVLVLAIAFFIARSASQNSMIVARGGATAQPALVGVYSGIAPDATPQPKAPDDATAAPSASPQPTQSASAAPHPSASPVRKPEETVAKAGAEPHKRAAAKRTKQVVAESDADDGGHIVPIVHTSQAQQGDAPKIVTAAATSAPEVIEQSTIAPAPAPPTQAPQSNEPVFAPQRVVDAQVRVAVQPDFPEAERERGEHGTSVVLVTIDPKGSVVSAVVGTSSGYSGLDKAAMTAARSSQFVAPKINGRPATETYRLVYDFAQ